VLLIKRSNVENLLAISRYNYAAAGEWRTEEFIERGRQKKLCLGTELWVHTTARYSSHRLGKNSDSATRIEKITSTSSCSGSEVETRGEVLKKKPDGDWEMRGSR